MKLLLLIISFISIQKGWAINNGQIMHIQRVPYVVFCQAEWFWSDKSPIKGKVQFSGMLITTNLVLTYGPVVGRGYDDDSTQEYVITPIVW